MKTTTPSAQAFLGRHLITRKAALSTFSLLATCLSATVAVAASPKPPACEKGAPQLVQWFEYEKALNALPREADCPDLAGLRAAYNKLPATTKFFSTTRGGLTARLALRQVGAPKPRVSVLVNGLLADHGTWAYVVGALGGDHELWLVDLPGCGDSEAPSPGKAEAEVYSPAAMADRILQAVEQALAARKEAGLPEPRVTFVGHSLGGTVCLRMFADPELRQRHAAMLRQTDGLVLFAPCDVAVNTEIPSFLAVLGLNGTKVRIGQVLGVLDDKIKATTRKAYQVQSCATREQAARFTRCLTEMPRLHAAQAMIRNSIPWQIKEHRPDWPAIKRLEAMYAHVDKPCLIVWGEWDETLPETMGHKIRDKVPGARLVEIEGAGHSAPSEVPLVCADIIRKAEAAIQTEQFAALPPVSSYGTVPFERVESPFASLTGSTGIAGK
jgi:pimeloyl-ACP methyl ester carboxylesterase